MANELGRTVIHRYMYARSWALGDRKSPLATTPCLIGLEGIVKLMLKLHHSMHQQITKSLKP